MCFIYFLHQMINTICNMQYTHVTKKRSIDILRIIYFYFTWYTISESRFYLMIQRISIRFRNGKKEAVEEVFVKLERPEILVFDGVPTLGTNFCKVNFHVQRINVRSIQYSSYSDTRKRWLKKLSIYASQVSNIHPNILLYRSRVSHIFSTIAN